MKPIVITLTAALFVSALGAWMITRQVSGGKSGPDLGISEEQAVREVDAAIRHYLPLLVNNPEMAEVVPKPIRSPIYHSRDPLVRLRNAEGIGAVEERHKEETRDMAKNYRNELSRFSGQSLRQISGSGYAPPVWNIQGHHYLTAHRQAHFDQTAIPLDILIVHPRVYNRQREMGLEVVNDPAETGLKHVGKLMFRVWNHQIDVIVSHAAVDHGYSTPAKEAEQDGVETKEKDEYSLSDLIVEGPVTNETTGHFYCLLAETSPKGAPLNWEDARRVGEALGGHLVVINDEQEQRWIESTFLGTNSLWIGLLDGDRNREFTWVNGDPLTYRNWAPGEPSSHHELCGIMWSETFRPGQGGMWNDSAFDWFWVQGLIEFEPGRTSSE